MYVDKTIDCSVEYDITKMQKRSNGLITSLLAHRNEYLNKMIKDIMNLSFLVTFVSIPLRASFDMRTPLRGG